MKLISSIQSLTPCEQRSQPLEQRLNPSEKKSTYSKETGSLPALQSWRNLRKLRACPCKGSACLLDLQTRHSRRCSLEDILYQYALHSSLGSSSAQAVQAA